jgi:hypothetical protein
MIGVLMVLLYLEYLVMIVREISYYSRDFPVD